jgi:hypothetical protein
MENKVAKYIEDTIDTESLAVNQIAMANRLAQILKEENCNNYNFLSVDGKIKFRKCLWLINQNIFGQLGKIDMDDEWNYVVKEGKEQNG